MIKTNKLVLYTFFITLSASIAAQAQTVGIGSNPQGSLFYATGTAISKLMSEKTDAQYRVAPYGGSSTYLPMVDRGELVLGLSNSGEAAFAYAGTGIFDGSAHPNLRLVGSLFSATNGWMVRADSDIKTVKDLAGKRVTAVFSSGRTFHYIAGASLAASGLDWDDVSRAPVSNYVQGVDMLINGRVEAAYSTVGVAAAQKAMASIRGGIRFIPIDDSGDVEQRLQSVMPTATPTIVKPSKADNGIVNDPTLLMKMDFVLLTSKNTSDDKIHDLTKLLHDNKKSLANSLGAFNRFNPNHMAATSPVPYHPAAIAYYKKIGIWNAAE